MTPEQEIAVDDAYGILRRACERLSRDWYDQAHAALSVIANDHNALRVKEAERRARDVKSNHVED